jgi:hypothetical protein
LPDTASVAPSGDQAGEPTSCGAFGEQEHGRTGRRLDDGQLPHVVAEEAERIGLPAGPGHDEDVAVEALVGVVGRLGRARLEATTRVDQGREREAAAVGRPDRGGGAAAERRQPDGAGAIGADHPELGELVEGRLGGRGSRERAGLRIGREVGDAAAVGRPAGVGAVHEVGRGAARDVGDGDDRTVAVLLRHHPGAHPGHAGAVRRDLRVVGHAEAEEVVDGHGSSGVAHRGVSPRRRKA